MNCHNIIELLSEYADDLLDSKTKKDIRKHLMTCKDCSHEYSLMQRYIKKMTSLKTIKAPADFLQKVNNNINEKFSFKRFSRFLFYPLEVKIPLEAAGLVTTILLIIFIFGPFKNLKQSFVKEVPSITDESFELAKSEEQDSYNTKKTEHEPPMEMAKKVSGNFIDTEEFSEDPHELKEELSDNLSKAASIPLEISLILPASYTGKSLKKSRSSTPLKSKAYSLSSMTDMEKEAISKNEIKQDNVETISQNNENIILSVKKIINKLNGCIIKQEEFDTKSNIYYITVDIPSSNFSQMLSNLNKLGQLKKPVPDIKPSANQMLRNRINLINAK